MEMLQAAGQAVVNFFEAIYALLWGDLVTIPLPGGSPLGLSLLVIILIPAGIYFTVRTRFLPFRLFPEMVRITMATTKSRGRRGCPACRPSSSPPPAGWAWAIWWAWSPRFPPAAREPCSGCG